MQSERAALVERVQYAEQRAAEAETAAERERGELAERASLLQSQVEAMRATRAWQLAARYWRVRRVTCRAPWARSPDPISRF